MYKIGVVARRDKGDIDNSPYEIMYDAFEAYQKPVYEMGCIPIIVNPIDGIVHEELLDLCDAFIMCGGKCIDTYYLDVISYAIKKNKPLLAICMGCQSLGVYSLVEDYLKKNNLVINHDNIDAAYKQIKKDKVMFLRPVEGHYINLVTYDNIKGNEHEIIFDHNSLFYNIYKTDKIRAISMHHYAIGKYGSCIKVVGHTDDVIEAIEYDSKDHFIIGTQYHPEISGNMIIFERLIEEINKRKTL